MNLSAKKYDNLRLLMKSLQWLTLWEAKRLNCHDWSWQIAFLNFTSSLIYVFVHCKAPRTPPKLKTILNFY